MEETISALVAARVLVRAFEDDLRDRWPGIIEGLLAGRPFRALAKELAISPAYLCEIYKGRKTPSPRIEQLLLTALKKEKLPAPLDHVR